MKKNVASQAVGAQMTSATDGSNFTGTVTVFITGDNGAQTIGSVGSGICTHEGKGYHSYAPAQAETNFDHIAFTFEGTGAVTATMQVYTAFPQTGDSFPFGAPPTVAAIADGVWDEAIAGHLAAGSTGLALNGATAPSAATVADAVWDEALAGHVAAGSTGEALGAAGSAGDPWITPLPGAYGAGSAGFIVGAFIDATISSRAEEAAILARLPASLVGGRMDSSVEAISPGPVTDIADGILTRDFAAVTGEAPRSALNALRFLRNKWAVAASVLTVTKEDDVTPAWTAATTGTPAADPITAVDPT